MKSNFVFFSVGDLATYLSIQGSLGIHYDAEFSVPDLFILTHLSAAHRVISSSFELHLAQLNHVFTSRN